MAGFEEMQLKAYYVGDNRTSQNWGRAASLALARMLAASFRITGRVTGDNMALGDKSPGYVGTLMPARYSWLYHWLLCNQNRRRLFAWYVKLEHWWGARDFIAEDPSKSIDNLLEHKRCNPALARLHDGAAAADFLVLDGNGDIVFSTPPRRETLFLLAMIELGVRLAKPVFLVNTMISDCPMTGRNLTTLAAAKRLFPRCRAVALRDPESLAYVAKEMPRARRAYIPDSLFAWYPRYVGDAGRPPSDGDFLLPHPESDEYWGKLDFSAPYVCIGGGALAGTDPGRAAECYGRLADAIRTLGYPVVLTENCVRDSFLQEVGRSRGLGVVPVNAPILACGGVLAHARLFISGRYHPSIFASLGGTPCIFLGSHAHKMESLPRVLEYDDPRHFSAFPSEAEVEAIVRLARGYLAQGETLRARIRQVARIRGEEARALSGFIQQALGDRPAQELGAAAVTGDSA